MEILVAALAAVGVVSALLTLSSANTRRPVRVRQTPIPIMAVVYSVIAAFVLFRFNDVVVELLRDINGYVPFIAQVNSPRQLLVWENILVISIFLILKIVVKPIFSRVFTESREFGKNLVSRVYEYDSEYGVWFVSRRFGNLRDYWRTLYWMSVALVFMFIFLAVRFSDWPGFTSISFPALAALVVGEFYFAIDGLTREEYERKLRGEQDSSRTIANYGSLRGILNRTFPDRVLSDNVQVSSAAALDSGFLIGEMARSGDEVSRFAGIYFEGLRESGVDLDVNLVESSLDLLRGSSQVISNPFYQDLTPYLCLPAYYNLLLSRKCLVIAGRDSIAPDLVEWMKAGLEEITGVPDLWNVEILEESGHDYVDVGILRYADIHNREVITRNDHFLSGVQFIILAEPSRMLATGQIGLSLVFSRCGKGAVKTFAAFDGSHDGLVDSLSHLLKVSLSEVVAAALPHGASSEMVWKPEGNHMSGRILPSVSRYLGVGTEISTIAWRYQVNKVNWIGGDVFPVVDMKWIVEQYYGTINQFSGLELSQNALQSSLEVTANPWGLPQKDNYFLVVEDEVSNIFETARRYATRAKDVGFVNLICENYLLRDYMIENRALFAADPKAIPSIVPDFARTERNVVLRLIMLMVMGTLSIDEIAQEFELADWSLPATTTIPAGVAAEFEPEIIGRLRIAVAEHTGVTHLALVKVRQKDVEFNSNVGIPPDRYGIDTGTDLDAVIGAMRPAYFYVEDEEKETNVIGSLLFDHVFQSLLPGQFVTYSGKYYEVQGISPDMDREGVVLRRAAEHIRDRRGYKQDRRYHISEIMTADSLGTAFHIGALEIVRLVATLRVETFGYYEYSDRSAMADARHIVISGVPERQHSRKSLLELRFAGIPENVRKTITVLLNEMFVTTFPYAHQYVTALTRDPDRSFGPLLTDLEIDGSEDSIFIVEDSMMDLGLVVAVERNWERFLTAITDYLEWNLTPYPPEPEKRKEKKKLVLPEIPEETLKIRWWRKLWRKIRGSKGPLSTGKVPVVPSVSTIDVELETEIETEPDLTAENRESDENGTEEHVPEPEDQVVPIDEEELRGGVDDKK
jgi:hypothetical protein